MTASNPTKKQYVNHRERLGGIISVLLFFILGAGIGSVLLIKGSDIGQVFSRKDHVSLKMKRRQDFRREQEQSLVICKRLEDQIAAYNPGINAAYEKNDIQFMINELNKKYEQNRTDKRYMVYLHLGEFYQMWFNDRQHLWSLNSNLAYIRRNLEECELGLGKKKEELRNK